MQGGRVTLKDIAAAADTSRSTVSLVLQRSSLVSAETRKRVEATIERLGYVYDRGAARLRTNRSGLIGVIVCEITNPFVAELTAGIETGLDRAGCVAILANTNDELDRQDRVIARICEQSVDGLILSPAAGTDVARIERLVGNGRPLVQVLRHVPGAATDFSGTANWRGTALATEHLMALGHERIAFLGGHTETSVSSDRSAGMQAVLARRGLAGRVFPCRHTIADAAQAAGAALAIGDPPTAFVCFNDMVAFGAMLAIERAGLAVGLDVGVVGFDDVAEAPYWRPALTSIAIDPRDIGNRAAELLLARVADNGRPIQTHVVEPRLVVRASCGAGTTRSMAA